jgi:predicted transcriptional regulator YdeE
MELEMTLESMGAFTIVGRGKKFSEDGAFDNVPGYWCEYYAGGYGEIVPGYLGVCVELDCGKEFTYMIGSFADSGASVPEGFTKLELPPRTWAKFKARGKIPGALQSLNRAIYTSWLPSAEYKLAEAMNIEVYSEGDMDADDYESEIWIPVEKK